MMPRWLIRLGGCVAALFLLTTPFSPSVLGADARSEAVKSDKDRLQGEWTMVSAEVGGSSMKGGTSSKRICRGNEVTVIVFGSVLMKAEVTLNPDKTPKVIDYQVKEGAHEGKKLLGIYEFDGDNVKFCYAAPNRERPTDFTTKPGDGRTSSVWKLTKAATSTSEVPKK